MKTDSKNDIVASLSVMDEVQMFKVLDFIHVVLAEREASARKPSREEAMHEIQNALNDFKSGQVTTFVPRQLTATMG
jgi:hypothetical protein